MTDDNNNNNNNKDIHFHDATHRLLMYSDLNPVLKLWEALKETDLFIESLDKYFSTRVVFIQRLIEEEEEEEEEGVLYWALLDLNSSYEEGI